LAELVFGSLWQDVFLSDIRYASYRLKLPCNGEPLDPISLDEFWDKIIAIPIRVYEKISQELPVKKIKKFRIVPRPTPAGKLGSALKLNYLCSNLRNIF